MFKIRYKIINSDYDDFVGQNGFFQLECNGYLYGEIYPIEFENVMDKVSIYDWFERLIRVSFNILKKNYVVLSDVESYNTWIEFKKENKNLIISIVQACKDSTKDIEYHLIKTKYGEWYGQKVLLYQFIEEVTFNANKYIKYVICHNKTNKTFKKLKDDIEYLYSLVN